MAMWRDPLDELIADLERAVPPVHDAPEGYRDLASWQADLIGLSLHVQALLWGGPEAVRRAEADPRVQRELANMTRRLATRPSS